MEDLNSKSKRHQSFNLQLIRTSGRTWVEWIQIPCTETETEDKHKKIDMCSTIDTQQQTSSTYTTKENRQMSRLSRHMEHR